MDTDKPAVFYQINPKVGVGHKAGGGENYRFFGPKNVSFLPLNL